LDRAETAGDARWSRHRGPSSRFQDRDGRYYWRLRAASNRITAWSGQGYDSKNWCVRDVNRRRANTNLNTVYDYTAELAQESWR
jgi:uncharacterized protein YegP (UPF0339 family)